MQIATKKTTCGFPYLFHARKIKTLTNMENQPSESKEEDDMVRILMSRGHKYSAAQNAATIFEGDLENAISFLESEFQLPPFNSSNSSLPVNTFNKKENTNVPTPNPQPPPLEPIPDMFTWLERAEEQADALPPLNPLPQTDPNLLNDTSNSFYDTPAYNIMDVDYLDGLQPSYEEIRGYSKESGDFSKHIMGDTSMFLKEKERLLPG